MSLFKLIIFIWTFYGLVSDLEATKCPKGQGRIRGKCEGCAKGYFQSEDNYEKRCNPCSRCDERTGSMVVQNCTATTNTKCQCPKGSVPLETDSVTCRCPIGHGLHNGECVKCKDGYFSDSPNKSCQKWSKCPSGVKKNGTNTKNVVCKDPEITPDPTSYRTPSVTRRSATKTTTAPPEPTVAPKGKDLTSNSSYTSNLVGVVLILGIFVLLIPTALICKLLISTCMQKETKKTDSLYRKPVEESGDSSLTLLKQDPKEP